MARLSFGNYMGGMILFPPGVGGDIEESDRKEVKETLGDKVALIAYADAVKECVY